MSEQEQHHIRLAEEKLSPHFTSLEVGSADELGELIQASRDAINAGNNPLDLTQPLAPADADFYRQAIDALEADLTPVFEATDQLIAALEGRGINTHELLAARMAAVSQHLHEHNSAPNYDSQLSSADRAAAQLRRRFHEVELQAVEDEGRWSLGLWGAYKTYVAGHDESGEAAAGFDEDDFIKTEVARLQTEGWGSATEAELRQILDGASELEREISGYLLDPTQMDAMKSDDIGQIREKINEFKTTILDGVNVAEAQVFYNRLVIMHQNLERTWLADVDNSFLTDAEDLRMLESERNQYGGFLVALNDLDALLQNLKTNDIYLASPGEIDESIREELERLLTALKAGEKFLNHRRISPNNKERLQILRDRLVGESEVLLGTQTDENFIFTDAEDNIMGDLEWWMFTRHGEQWRAVQFFWEQYNADNAQALNLNPRYGGELSELASYFVAQMRSLDKDDRAFHQRFIALDIQVNRLQMIMAAMGEIPDPEEAVEIDTNLPEHGLPSGFEHPEDTVGGWEQYYTEVVVALGPAFLRNQAKELREMLEDQADIEKSFAHQFLEDKRWDGLNRAMHHYSGPEQEEIHELAELFEKYKTLFEAQVSPAHSVSMTCDMDQLPDWEHHGVGTELFDYFTLGESEGREGEKRYKYSHHVQSLVQILKKILQENPTAGFKGRDDPDGSAIMNGVHQEGWFGYYYWKDTPENRDELKARMKHELTKAGGIAPDLAEEDIDDVIFFAHRVATMTGIRQDLFAPYMASGATPVDMLGDLSSYIAEVNLYAPELYSTYKKRVYLQLAEMIEIPEDWWAEIGSHKKASPVRMDSVQRSFKASRIRCEMMGELREPLAIPIEADGINIKNTYYSMFDLFFNDEVREKRRGRRVTLKAWKRGKGEFVTFKKLCFDTPGGVDVGNIDSLNQDELIEKLVGHVDQLINKGLSYMKKNYDLAQWKDMAIMIRWAIDRCFRVYALKDESFTGSTKLLKQIRARLNQANTVIGAGKMNLGDIRKTDSSLENTNLSFDGTPLSPISVSEDQIERLRSDNPLASDGSPVFSEKQIEQLRTSRLLSFSLSEDQLKYLEEIGVRLSPISVSRGQIEKLENAGAILSPLSKKKGETRVVDVRDFLLESYPDWTIVDFGDAMPGGKLDITKIRLKVPRRTEQQMDIIMPALDEQSWLENPAKSIQYTIMTNDLLTANEYSLFKQTAAKGIFGIKPEEQQKDPDEKK